MRFLIFIFILPLSFCLFSCGEKQPASTANYYECNYFSLKYPADWLRFDTIYPPIDTIDNPWVFSAQIEVSIRKPDMFYSFVTIKRSGMDLFFSFLSTPEKHRSFMLYSGRQTFKSGEAPYYKEEIIGEKDSTTFMGYPSADVWALEYYDYDTLLVYAKTVFAEDSRYNLIVRTPYYGMDSTLIYRDIDEAYDKVLYNIKFYNYKDEWDSIRWEKLEGYRY